jgi:hypothetical protein
MCGQFRSLVLVVALGMTAGCAAGVGLNVYDEPHRDYHRWNSGEERSYRAYLAEQHREYRPFGKIERPEQDKYWDWRHSHPDSEKR